MRKSSIKSQNISNSNRYELLKFEKQVSGCAVTKNSNMGYIRWGSRNDYPNLLLNLYANSPTHAACIHFEVQSIVGGGVDYDQMQLDGSQLQPNYQQTWNAVIRALATDYALYGSYALQVIKNKDNKTFSFWPMPLDKVRWSEYDEDGQVTSYWVSRDWTATGKYPPFEIDAFDMLEDYEQLERGKPYLYVYRPYNPLQTYYTSPAYISALKAIQSEIEYLNFDLKSTTNSFVPAGMLLLNEVETDEQRQAIVENVQQMFTGSENANSLMVTFRSNIEQNEPKFIPFQTSSDKFNLFESANVRNINRILSSHQIPNASLVGMPDMVGSGFASEADKLEVAYNLYNQLVGNYNRDCVINTLNAALKMNGIDTEIILKPISFLNDDKQVKTDVPEAEKQTNVEEQETGRKEE